LAAVAVQKERLRWTTSVAEALPSLATRMRGGPIGPRRNGLYWSRRRRVGERRGRGGLTH
jgi:hypothetical protein